MSATAWLLLAGTLVLLPGPAAALPRVRALAARGRLAAPAPAQHRARRAGPVVAVRPLAGVGCAAIALAVTSVVGAVPGIASGVAAVVLARSATVAGARRQRQRRLVELLAGLRLLVAELDSGSRPAAALRAAGAGAPAYAAQFERAAGAVGTTGQVAATLLGCGQPELHALAHGWSVAERCGTPLAGTVARVADDVAARVAQQRAIAVALAGPRASTVLLAALPLLGVGLGTAMGARPVSILLTTPAGHGVLAGGVLLEAAGVLWTARLLARAERA